MTDDRPPLVLEVALEPKSRGDEEKLGVALQKLAAEHPFFRVSKDPVSGQTILMGQSEQDLDRIIGWLKDEFAVELVVGAPQVAYRETLGRRTEIDYTHKKQTGGSGQFARVNVVFEPGSPGSGYSFENKIVGGAVPKEYVRGVENGLASAKENGLLAGFPVIDFKATLVDGAYHDVDSNVLAFEIAARAAFHELREKGSPRLLEPVMRVEVVTPGGHAHAIVGDLHGRRGEILDLKVCGDVTVVTAMVPLANMSAYARDLRGISRAQAHFAMQFDHYGPLPQPDDDPPTFSPAIGMRA